MRFLPYLQETLARQMGDQGSLDLEYDDGHVMGSRKFEEKVVCTELYKVSISREGRRQRRLSTQAAVRYVFEAVGL